MPDASMMNPEPSELTRRGVGVPPRFWSPCPPRQLKKSRNSSSNCGSFGSCGAGVLRAATFCEVEILTTASITCSAMSATASGPRANEGTVSDGRTSTEMAAAVTAGRWICLVNRARVPSMEIEAPGEVEAGTVLLSDAVCKGSTDGGNRAEIRAEFGTCTLPQCRSSDSAAHQPDQHHSKDRGHHASNAQRSVRRLQRVRRHPLHRLRESRENKPLHGKHETDGDDKIGHLSGPIPPTAVSCAHRLTITSSCCRLDRTLLKCGATVLGHRPGFCRTDRRRSGRIPNRA